VWDVGRRNRVVQFSGNDAWTSCWASANADRIIAGDAVGCVHFLACEAPAPTRLSAQLP